MLLDRSLSRELTEPEDKGRKVEGSNPAASIRFFHWESLLNIHLLHLTTIVQLYCV